MKIYEIVSENSKIEEGLGSTVVNTGINAAKKGLSWAQKAWAARQAKKAADVAAGSKKAVKVGKAAKDAAAKTAPIAVKKGSAFFKILEALGVLYYAYEYWNEVGPIEDDFEEFVASIKNKTEVSEKNRFRGMTYEQALAEAEGMRNKAMGKAVAGAVISGGFVGKFVSAIGSILKLFPIFGPLIGIPTRGIGFLISKIENGKLSGPARIGFIYWLENTEAGKAVMENVITALILGGIGAAATTALDAVVKGLDEFLKWLSQTEFGKKLGLNLSVPQAVKTKIKPDAELEPDSATNKNIKYVDGIYASTTDGYLRSDRDFWTNPRVKDSIDQALRQGKPHPLKGIPLNPKLAYPTDLFKSMKFSPN